MGIVLGFVLLAVALGSIVALVIQLRSTRLERGRLADGPNDAGGVSPAGMIFGGNSTSR